MWKFEWNEKKKELSQKLKFIKLYQNKIELVEIKLKETIIIIIIIMKSISTCPAS